MGLVEIELERHRWNVWRCGCGATTEHLVPELRRVVRAKTPSAADVRHITPHVCGPGRLSAPAAAVTQVVLAALAAGATEVTRDELLALLRALVDDAGISAGPGVAGADGAVGDDRADRADRADRKRVARCRAVAREATWLLFAEVVARHSVAAAGHAVAILGMIGADEERLAEVQRMVGIRPEPERCFSDWVRVQAPRLSSPFAKQYPPGFKAGFQPMPDIDWGAL